MQSQKIITSFMLFLLVAGTSGCATIYESACHELASERESQINSMVKKANSGSFERHVVLLETGNEISSKCRSHYIDAETFRSVPDSLKGKCNAQSSAKDKYCIMYQLDRDIVKERVY